MIDSHEKFDRMKIETYMLQVVLFIQHIVCFNVGELILGNDEIKGTLSMNYEFVVCGRMLCLLSGKMVSSFQSGKFIRDFVKSISIWISLRK